MLSDPPLSDPDSPRIAGDLRAIVPILDRKLVKTCHIALPDMPKPVGAIAYSEKLFSYVKFYPTLEAAQRASERMIKHGNTVVLTRVPKGLVLWVLEPDAQLVQ
ncbi:MAG: hypothetical protein K6T90_17525 [Leptolyngbyaceae cyanobacterium HOT.MB2.61]|jgi:hypothetical protein|nr:hypothetical protein [Leptolyngbyaceae cyanobacterium HOT.MB2.61]